MTCNQRPTMGVPIYLNNCHCENLCEWAGEDTARPLPVEDCGIPEAPFGDWPVAMAYVPMQPWGEPYDYVTALERGTLFPSLDLPFEGGGRR